MMNDPNNCSWYEKKSKNQRTKNFFSDRQTVKTNWTIGRGFFNKKSGFCCLNKSVYFFFVFSYTLLLLEVQLQFHSNLKIKFFYGYCFWRVQNILNLLEKITWSNADDHIWSNDWTKIQDKRSIDSKRNKIFLSNSTCQNS